MTFNPEALDRYITGNYGEDQFTRGQDTDEPADVRCGKCGSTTATVRLADGSCDDCAEREEVTCPCCGASQFYLSKENPYCDACDTDTCGHWDLATGEKTGWWDDPREEEQDG